MSVLEAVLLGIIQGVTEFLPISSTAHLTLTGKLLGLIDARHPEAWTKFIAVMQLGTLASVLVYFWRDIAAMMRAVVEDAKRIRSGSGIRELSKESWLALCILIGTLPVALFGYALKHVIEGALTKSTLVIIGSLAGLAVLLWIAEKVAQHRRTINEVRWWDALIIGIAQALALIPGSSRSGTTITAALFLGITREAAARFSFLLSIPAVLASGVFEMLKIHPDVFQLGIFNLVVATVVSALSGYAAIAWLLRYLMRNTTMVFVWYRFGLGFLLAVMLWYGLMQP